MALHDFPTYMSYIQTLFLDRRSELGQGKLIFKSNPVHTDISRDSTIRGYT